MPRVYYKNMFPVDFPEGATQQDVEEYFKPYQDGGNTFTDGVRTVAGMLSRYQNRQQPQSVMPHLSGLIGLNQDQINNLMSLSQRDQMFQQQQRQEQDLAEKARQQRMFELAEARKNYRDQLTGRLRADMIRQAANIQMKEREAQMKANAPRVLSQGQAVYDPEGKLLYGNEKPEATRMVKVWRGGKQYTLVGTDKDIAENPEKYASEQPPRRGGEGGGEDKPDALLYKRIVELGGSPEYAAKIANIPPEVFAAAKTESGGLLNDIGDAITKYTSMASVGINPQNYANAKQHLVKTGMSEKEADERLNKYTQGMAVSNTFRGGDKEDDGKDDDKKISALMKDAANIMNTEEVDSYEAALSLAAERRSKAEQFVKGTSAVPTPPAPAGTLVPKEDNTFDYVRK